MDTATDLNTIPIGGEYNVMNESWWTSMFTVQASIVSLLAFALSAHNRLTLDALIMGS